MPDGLPLRPEDPAELGGHRLLRRLGEGNQGVVYLGLSPSGEHVAIKLLHARMAEDPGARERFVRELSAAKKVARFCTAQVLDADLAGDHPYIVSEYVEGHSLRSHIIKQGPRTGGALERLAIGTLTALAAIHKAGIVHRDFTPHNVLLGPDGPRVIDFGIARALGAVRNDETNSVGTPSYMAPEQVSGREIGPPADMFAWGSTILFAGTGRPPFGNEAVHAVMERIMESEPDVSALPEPLRSVVAACLAKDPAQRPTAQQAQAGLLGDEATEALMPPPAFGTSTGLAGTDAGAPGADFHSPVTPPLGAVSSALGAADKPSGSAPDSRTSPGQALPTRA
ncbi:MAG: serine/threonine-protein kinase, partial [Actinoallomurus sp.]